MDVRVDADVVGAAVSQNQHEVLITQVQAGKYTVVYPPEVAAGKPIIPAPRWNQR